MLHPTIEELRIPYMRGLKPMVDVEEHIIEELNDSRVSKPSPLREEPPNKEPKKHQETPTYIEPLPESI